jgi:hypothetical protein
MLKPAKKPKPAMALCGALSLKRNGVPTANRKARADGRQKLASRGPGSRERRSNQPGSVTATKPSTRGMVHEISEAPPSAGAFDFDLYRAGRHRSA